MPKGTKNISFWSKTQSFLTLTFGLFPVALIKESKRVFSPVYHKLDTHRIHVVLLLDPKEKETCIMADLYQQKILIGVTLKKEFLNYNPGFLNKAALIFLYSRNILLSLKLLQYYQTDLKSIIIHSKILQLQSMPSLV